MNVYPDIDQQEIERQYYLRGLRPDYENSVIPDWIERSNQFLAKSNAQLDIEYGKSQRNTLDFFFSGKKTSDLVLYIHGGYWQRGDKSVYHFLAEGFLNNGISVALINYPMCPTVRLPDIADHVRQSVIWLWRNADELSFSRERFNIVGHSAGGHLTAEMMLTDWQKFDSALAPNPLHCGIALSGIYDLRPLLQCSENERLKLDEDQVSLASPMSRKIPIVTPMLIGYGELEPDDMHRQSLDFFQTFNNDNSMQCHGVSNADHFDVVNVLGDESSELFEKTLATIMQ